MANVAIIGCGYVGLAWAKHLSNTNTVNVWEKDSARREAIILYLSQHIEYSFNVLDKEDEAYIGSEIVIVAVPTDFSEENKSLDTTIVEEVVDNILKNNPEALIVIKSTLPVGCTSSLRKKHNTNQIVYMPEFLREGMEEYDCSNPSRIIVGGITSEEFVIYSDALLISDSNVFYMSPEEAEAVKLFSNAYLAMRVSFFNELDSFAENHGIDSGNIINGLCADYRIGDYYNNPSFGYGGYCLPKDTKQLNSSQSGQDDSIVSSVIKANSERKEHVVSKILSYGFNRIGFYRIISKKGSESIKESATIEIINKIIETNDVEIFIYEPNSVNRDLFEEHSSKIVWCNSLIELDQSVDLIVANRVSEELIPYKEKVYTRDLFCRD